MTGQQWVRYARGAMHDAIRQHRLAEMEHPGSRWGKIHASNAKSRAGDAWFYLRRARWAKELTEPAIERGAA